MKLLSKIECPDDWQIEDDYSSHRPLIYLVLKNNINKCPVVEFGSGNKSTQLIRELCNKNGVQFTSYETDPEWSKQTDAKLINSFNDISLLDGFIVFIDGKPGEERKDLIHKNKDKQVLIIHDTEETANYVYQMRDVLNTFKYRLDFIPYAFPHTTAVSNCINIENWV